MRLNFWKQKGFCNWLGGVRDIELAVEAIFYITAKAKSGKLYELSWKSLDTPTERVVKISPCQFVSCLKSLLLSVLTGVCLYVLSSKELVPPSHLHIL